MATQPEEGVSHLSLEYSPLERIPRLTKDTGIGLHSLVVVGERFFVGRDLPRLIPGFEQVLLRLLPVLRLGVVVGEEAVELLQAVGEKAFDGLGHTEVQSPSALKQDRLVGGLLHQGVLEDVLELRFAGLLPDELQGLERLQILVEGGFRLRQGVKDAVEEAPADDGRQTEHLFQLLVQAVDAGHDDALQGVRDADLRGPLGDLPPAVLVGDETPEVDEGPDDLLHEQGVSLGPLIDGVSEAHGQVAQTHQVRHQGMGLLQGEGGEEELLVAIGVGLPGQVLEARRGGVRLRAPHQAEEDRGLLCQGEQVLEQTCRGVVQPVDVLEDEDEGALLRQAADEEAHGAEHLPAHGVPAQVPDLLLEFFGHGQGEESGEVGEDVGGLVLEEPPHQPLELLRALRLVVVGVDAGGGLQELQEGPVAELAGRRRGSGPRAR